MATLKKNQTAKVGEKYSYKYVDIAQIHDYLEENNLKYYQYIDTCDINGQDYIYTVIIEDGKELPARRGCRVVDATLYGNDNPAQKQGSALTYARRYSLLMAFGLATEDDDAASLNTKQYTIEDAKEYKLTFGKYKGETLESINDDDPDYIEWLAKNSTSEDVKAYLKLLFNISKEDYEVDNDTLKLTTDIMKLVDELGVDLDAIKETYKIESLNNASNDVLNKIHNRLLRTKETRAKVVANNE